MTFSPACSTTASSSCGEEVNDTTASLVVAQLLYLEAQDPDKDIQLYINSPGGSVTAGMAIYDTMQYIKCDVSTICIGMAASMGAFLLVLRCQGQAHRPAQQRDHDPPALRRHAGQGHRHGDRRGALPEDQAAYEPNPVREHRQARRAGEGRLRARQLDDRPRRPGNTAWWTRSFTSR